MFKHDLRFDWKTTLLTIVSTLLVIVDYYLSLAFRDAGTLTKSGTC